VPGGSRGVPEWPKFTTVSRQSAPQVLGYPCGMRRPRAGGLAGGEAGAELGGGPRQCAADRLLRQGPRRRLLPRPPSRHLPFRLTDMRAHRSVVGRLVHDKQTHQT
jgi:hypothetical protein